MGVGNPGRGCQRTSPGWKACWSSARPGRLRWPLRMPRRRGLRLQRGVRAAAAVRVGPDKGNCCGRWKRLQDAGGGIRKGGLVAKRKGESGMRNLGNGTCQKAEGECQMAEGRMRDGREGKSKMAEGECQMAEGNGQTGRSCSAFPGVVAHPGQVVDQSVGQDSNLVTLNHSRNDKIGILSHEDADAAARVGQGRGEKPARRPKTDERSQFQIAAKS